MATYGQWLWQLQRPAHHATYHDEVMFAEWLESMRKNIECTFGILKSRFRNLKNAIRLYFEDDIVDLFRTCAVLHNILLQFDGLLNVDWATVDPNVEEPEEDPEATQPLEMDLDQTQDIRDQPLQDANFQPTQHEPEDHIIEWNQNMFFELRGALVKNLAYQFRMDRGRPSVQMIRELGPQIALWRELPSDIRKVSAVSSTFEIQFFAEEMLQALLPC